MSNTEKTKAIAASKAGMDEKTARKYLTSGRLPSQLKKEHDWRTREDAFEDIWPKVKQMLEDIPGLEAKYLFEYLQRENPGKFSDGQLRTFQRRVKFWKATEGHPREVYFPQKHYPGKLCASDFTHLTSLGVTINGRVFEHILYHFVLTYSNWETGTICYSESYEALSEGFQNALWELGGVPDKHRSDRLTAAINQDCNPEEFTARYRGLLNHYKIRGQRTNANKGHENGDAEQRHHRFKRALNQALLLRGSRDFSSKDEYIQFLTALFRQLNAGRKKRLQEELKVLRRLPVRRLNDCRREKARVGASSTVQILTNTYSVHSRLIGEKVEARIYADHIDVWYGQKQIDTLPRLRGRYKHRIEYRHIIDWLVRKPGAFQDYRWREDMFPTSHFRIAYDHLCARYVQRTADKEYLAILYLAARGSEEKVEQALRQLICTGKKIARDTIAGMIKTADLERSHLREVFIEPPQLDSYDDLYESPLQEVIAHA